MPGPVQQRDHQKGDAASTAVYSPCGLYRYLLTRVWDAAGPKALFVMLNPSTATELQNDPTVERCERRARALGYGAFRVTNIFAWRATDPMAMRAVADPVGPLNDMALRQSVGWADLVLCAWGTHGAHLGRGAAVASMLRGGGKPLHHLGVEVVLQVSHQQADDPAAAGFQAARQNVGAVAKLFGGGADLFGGFPTDRRSGGEDAADGRLTYAGQCCDLKGCDLVVCHGAVACLRQFNRRPDVASNRWQACAGTVADTTWPISAR